MLRDRFKYSLTTNEAGEPVGLYEALIRAGIPGAVPGRSASPPRHSHKTQTECFTVRCGTLAVRLVLCQDGGHQSCA